MTEPVSELDPLNAARETRERELGAPLWERVWGHTLWEVNYEVQRVVETIAQHSPGLAPAIRALAKHAEGDDVESGCCGLPRWEPDLPDAEE